MFGYCGGSEYAGVRIGENLFITGGQKDEEIYGGDLRRFMVLRVSKGRLESSSRSR